MKAVILFLSLILITSVSKAQLHELIFEDMPEATEPVLKPQVKFIQLSTGVKLEYAEQGNASGVPVIFLHGFSDSWRSFELNLPYLPASVRAFSLSQRGHGNSDKPLNGYRPADFALDVAALMDQLKIKKAIIVGHSMGSTNARAFAVAYPEKTLGLVLMGSFESFDDNPGVRELEIYLSKMEEVDINFVTEFQKSTILRPVPPEYLETVISESMKLPVYVWQRISEGWAGSKFSEKLKNYKKPVLLIWGDKDSIVPAADQDILRNAMKNSRLEVYKGTGHALHWEEPQRFALDLLEFVREIKN